MKIRIGNIQNSIIHYSGNKANGEGVKFSDIETSLIEVENEFKKIIDNTFSFDEMYCFDFVSKLELNPVYNFTSEIFDNTDCFIAQSQNIVRYLYDQSTHSKIKGGELYVILFKDCDFDNKKVNALGLFKTEVKNTFLQVQPTNNGYNKLDKGCLIFNDGRSDGYFVAIVDNTNKLEAKYWKDDFLHVIQRQDSFYQTKNVVSLCKKYLEEELLQSFEVTKVEQAALLNKSLNILKDNESIDLEEFAQEVFVKPEIIQSFNKYKSNYQEENNIHIEDSFDISEQALRRVVKGSMNIIKLDKNFDINIHGGEHLLQKGYDNEKKCIIINFTL
ncbi:nucleoid-associated protein [Dysgonomonas sp. GY75]|jgi:hypothetical protein|uniref:nucleoid-associated protein n=1 Tax=Dysgonomonas sp. GY75 TaxID=2780419 RepID=UPI0018837CC2|nr:nucleoid-associated protein [Dysgonomonas sp. GY75]MBF0647906.1 nucleoid-associated protein [Dysgonomonas sp. GY75]